MEISGFIGAASVVIIAAVVVVVSSVIFSVVIVFTVDDDVVVSMVGVISIRFRTCSLKLKDVGEVHARRH